MSHLRLKAPGLLRFLKSGSAFAIILVVFTYAALGAESLVSERLFKNLDDQLNLMEEQVKRGSLEGPSVRSLRQSAQNVLDKTEDLRQLSASEVSRINRLLASLGPAPEDGSEDSVVSIEREQLSSELSIHEGHIKRLDLMVARAEQVLMDLTNATRSRYREYLLARSPSPWSIESWRVAVREFTELLYRSYIVAPKQWLASFADNQTRADLSVRYTIITILIAAAGWPLRKWVLARYGRQQDISEPPFARRLTAAFVEAAGHGIIPLLFVVSVRFLFMEGDLLTYELRVVVDAVTRSLAIYFIGHGLIKAIFTPDNLAWRLTTLRSGASKRVVQRLRSILIIFVVFHGLGDSLAWSSPSNVMNGVYVLAYALALYTALWALLRHRVWITGGAAAVGSSPEKLERYDDDVRGGTMFWSRVRVFSTLALLSVPAAAATGYTQLTLFLIDAAVLSSLFIAGYLAVRWLLHSLIGEVVTRQRLENNNPAAFLSSLTEQDESGRHKLTFWISLIIDVFLIAIALSLLLTSLGVHSDDLFPGFSNFMRGIEIGSYTFSPVDVLLALITFSVIMVVTRVVQRGLERHFLPKAIRDIGVRDALKTSIGYVGVVIAGLVGISMMGLDLSNLALIAGALSVGLGFGLQNVVSNFVSGLILLAERPIKTGDWIVVNNNEGTVKKINFRSTEIETFQRASLIIPNADLISNPVTNWTHKNVRGRLEVRVGVAYGSDVELVRDILLEIAKNHPMVLSDPEPAVVFRDFGASSLDFELRCFLSDIGWVVVVGSEMRFTINAEFARNGIEIPFPQQVVHFADSATTESTPLRSSKNKSRTSEKPPLRSEVRDDPDGADGD